MIPNLSAFVQSGEADYGVKRTGSSINPDKAQVELRRCSNCPKPLNSRNSARPGLFIYRHKLGEEVLFSRSKPKSRDVTPHPAFLCSVCSHTFSLAKPPEERAFARQLLEKLEIAARNFGGKI